MRAFLADWMRVGEQPVPLLPAVLDELRTLLAEVLEVSTAEVNKVREDLLQEQASADARYAATSALLHPEGSTTPLNEAYSRAQDRVASIRRKAEKVLPSAFALLLALELAEQRRDEAKLHRDIKCSARSSLDACLATSSRRGQGHC